VFGDAAPGQLPILARRSRDEDPGVAGERERERAQSAISAIPRFVSETIISEYRARREIHATSRCSRISVKTSPAAAALRFCQGFRKRQIEPFRFRSLRSSRTTALEREKQKVAALG